MSTENVAGNEAPINIEINPTDSGAILLHGWLRAYAEYDELFLSEDKDYGENYRGDSVRLELYEATDGQWVYVQTVRGANIAGYRPRQCDVQIFRNRDVCQPHFRMGRRYAAALMKKAGLSHVQFIGHEKAAEEGDDE
ncbi:MULTISPECIES: hypothetical protein [Vibrio]|uniref:Uncharacterized protein n=2 Tax=Vibrio TaxID=662 RepID=F9S144_9VIBR|nr:MULTISPECIES: hypothetical protein [Vibrio]ANU39377.1 hypothetical protein VSVS05_04342 [Vibrio scophthalmi]EGU42404.1 hypothetical protein VII00023_00510 [Vibrio ichthyoenteri ATCC 700023]